jgi:alpha-L-rhamnosidase
MIYRIRHISILVAGLALLASPVRGFKSTFPSSLLENPWLAYWIQVPEESRHAFGVYLFRKDFDLRQVPSSFIIHVSADNRYKLMVNEKLVSLGPARGDILHWRFETVDISSYLSPGKNAIAAIVWNDGDMKPLAQISYRTGFIVQGNSPTESVVNTDRTWKCVKDRGFSQLRPIVIGYYAASPGECLDMHQHENGWEKVGYIDSSWKNAEEIFHGNPKGVFTFDDGWMLVPSPIPQMEMRTELRLVVREAVGVNVPAGFQSGNSSLTIPPTTNVKLILDQTYLTDAYPTLVFDGGTGAVISVKYAEAMYSETSKDASSPAHYDKGNRNDISGKEFIGLEDRIISDGGSNRSFTPLWWRAYRYIQVEVHTQNEPLTIKDIFGTYTGYPFNLKARFESSDTSLEEILNVGWHTVRLCSFETFMDCPYYEQLQYIGDTRIQALVSYFNSCDYRLARNAIDLLDNSRIAEGLTQSRFPSSSTQLIPTFSLWWIGMLHDYWMYTTDSGFVKNKLPGERQILSFFHQFQDENGSLVNLPNWDFTDWVDSKDWEHGVAPRGNKGNSSILDLQLLWAYELAGEMENKLGMKAYARLYQDKAFQLKKTILQTYWNSAKKEFADTPEKETYSQHANALAILTGVVSGTELKSLGHRILSDTTMTQATIYFKYYINYALVKAGLGNDYLNWLGTWKENLKYGMTTWGETSDLRHTRSDCHGWGASPNIEFFRTVLGIESYAPGFNMVRIEPHLGSLTNASGKIPHPAGEISADYVLKNGLWNIRIDLPKMISGSLVWRNKTYRLNGGNNQFTFKQERF